MCRFVAVVWECMKMGTTAKGEASAESYIFTILDG